MRTLKICVIAASLLLFAIPTFAGNYPPKIQKWIEQSQDQFICALPSSVSVQFYLKPGGTIAILTYEKQEKIISRVDINGGILSQIKFVRLKDEWRPMRELSEKEKKEARHMIQFIFFDKDLPEITPCVDSNLRNRGLLPGLLP